MSETFHLVVHNQYYVLLCGSYEKSRHWLDKFEYLTEKYTKKIVVNFLFYDYLPVTTHATYTNIRSRWNIIEENISTSSLTFNRKGMYNLNGDDHFEIIEEIHSEHDRHDSNTEQSGISSDDENTFFG